MKIVASFVLAFALLGWQGSEVLAGSGAEGSKLEQAPALPNEQARIEAMLQSPPKATEMVIEYRPVKGLERTSMWHIGDSGWWVRLYRSSGFSMNDLDKTKRYRVTGIVLEQNYGVVEVWMQEYSPGGG